MLEHKWMLQSNQSHALTESPRRENALQCFLQICHIRKLIIRVSHLKHFIRALLLCTAGRVGGIDEYSC